jgi:uncharacterized protein (TIGR02246 family)
MNLRFGVVALVAVCFAAPGTAGSPVDGDSAARAVADQFIDAWNRHDMVAFGALYADDADFVNVVGTWLKGRAEIQRHHETIHLGRMKTSHLTSLETEVRSLSPDVVIVHVRWELTGQVGRDGEQLPTRQGLLSHVVRRSAGAWLIASSQNTDIVAAPGAPTAR